MSLYTDLLKKSANSLNKDQLLEISNNNNLFSKKDIQEYYWPLVELIGRRIVSKKQNLTKDRNYLKDAIDTPYVVSISGSVASGKTSMAQLLAGLLHLLPGNPKVDIVSTDCFLFPTAILTERNLMNQKGFPISYDWNAMIQFLKDLHSGKTNFQLPIYSHETYDILKDEFLTINNPQIIIVEGLNLLQLNTACGYIPTDFIDFSIYIDVSKDLLEEWFLKRIAYLRQEGKGFYARLVNLTEDEAKTRADRIWKTINLPNLEMFIEPTRSRANAIIDKGIDHLIKNIKLRK